MLAFVLRRVLLAVPVLLVCVTLLFGLMRAIGGTPPRHGPPLGLSNEAWVTYSDAKPSASRWSRSVGGSSCSPRGRRGCGGRASCARTSSGPPRSRSSRWPGRWSGSRCRGCSSSSGSSRYPGIGRYFIAAAQARDYPLTLGLTVVLTTAVVMVNLLSDVALAAVDPRLREAP